MNHLRASVKVSPADHEREQNDQRFRRLLEAAPDAILEVDVNGRITLAMRPRRTCLAMLALI